MRAVMLEGKGDFIEWRNAARTLLLERRSPQEIDWRCRDDAAGDLFGPAPETVPLAGVAPQATLTVPQAFLSLAEAVICHSDPARFQLLYRVLFRLQEERALLEIRSDVDIAQLHAMEKSVRRDCHKMTAFVRFKEIEGTLPRRRFLAWFEPDHHIVARAAPFFQRRFTDMDWIIATPKGTAAWDGANLTTSTEPADNPMLTDDTDALWRTYFANIFNPARLKVKMMQTEMPKKYWKNLPEAQLIPGMIASAEASVVAMAERAARDAPLFHERLQAAARAVPDVPSPPAGTLEEARAAARTCTRCALHCKATQTVFGEGPADARMMIVGEQPGDQEDLAGRPFVGPAGKLFDTVAGEVGLNRTQAYVTNAVKHFKYEPRGKRRIHQKPNMGEVQHCKWWLKLELDLVKPKLVVAMGATALAALTDSRQKLSDLRGQVLSFGERQSLLVTVHPSYLLRIPDADRRMEEMSRFRTDLATAATF
ncbi:UdgX family uracil-DNA binding protein [Pararhizobium sp. O133]|uniref:UdgX family uracil-DNA binding protein n=1 Tax=Pararhizobium sp. O133 TaxID=3449278 RepID=UPI003F68585F